jgi:hypothetical protein
MDAMRAALISQPAGWRRLIGPAALAAALSVPAAHAAGSCDMAAPPQVTLAPVFGAPVIDVSLGLAALQGLARRSASLHRELGLLLGLTTTQLVGSFEDTVEYGEAVPSIPGRTFCGVTREVHLRLGFEDVVVHIAHEVTGDRCLYDQVYQHENRHVEVDRALLAEAAPRVAVAIGAAATAIGVVYGASPDAVSREVRQRVQGAFDAAFGALEQEMHRRQGLVDQPEEYRRLGQACGGAGARLVAASRRPPG